MREQNKQQMINACSFNCNIAIWVWLNENEKFW